MKESVVDAYIGRQPVHAQPALQRVRRLIRKVLPDAEETLSYQIPAYKVRGRCVVYFAGWKHHWSLYPVTDRVRAALGPALAPYEVSKGTVRFPLAAPVPARLVEHVVGAPARAAQAPARASAARGRTVIKSVSARQRPRRPGDARRRPKARHGSRVARTHGSGGTERGRTRRRAR